MNWRPKDWRDIQTALIRKAYADWDNGSIKARTRYGVDGEISEASADAILEALKKVGTPGTFYTNENHEVCSEEGNPICIPCEEGRVKGTVVLIPDEEVNDG